MTRGWLVFAAAIAGFLGGCGNRVAAPIGVKVLHLPPTPKDAIDALLASSQIPLGVDPSCQSAGTEPGDKTIGRYFSGFMAQLSDAKAANAIETSIEAARPAGGEAVWLCRVMLRHAQGEDVWRWGVQFSVRQKDGVVLPDTFRCLGAG